MPAAWPKHEDARSRQPAGGGEAHNHEGLVHERSPASSSQRARPSRRSQRGLDWFVFFLADAQMGFGPLVAVFLTTQKWTQVDIGLVLTVGSLVALAGQIPGGALVDAARSERVLAAWAVGAIGASAFLIGAWPVFAAVLTAKLLHSAASCVLGPAIAAISLGLVGHAAISERLGRNARYAAVGAGLAALAMGAVGYLISNRSCSLSWFRLSSPTRHVGLATSTWPKAPWALRSGSAHRSVRYSPATRTITSAWHRHFSALLGSRAQDSSRSLRSCRRPGGSRVRATNFRAGRCCHNPPERRRN